MHLSLACSLHILRISNIVERGGELRGEKRGEKRGEMGGEKWSVTEANGRLSAIVHSSLVWNSGERARIVIVAAAGDALLLRSFLRIFLHN